MPIFTHDQIDTSGGILSKVNTTLAAGNMWGGNALQSISISRNTPKDPQQAVGYLGIVDYTSGTIASDCQLDSILVEDCDPAAAGSSVYQYAAKELDPTQGETYVATSFGVGLSAGSPGTFGVGLLTAGLASYLAVQARPSVETGEESSYAVVMGDDGSGISLVATWDGSAPEAATVPILTAAGALGTLADSSLPAGVQSINFNATINRDQILDVRTASPVQYVTTYPIDINVDLDVLQAPYYGTNFPGGAGYQPDREVASPFGSAWDNLIDLSVVATNLGKHPSGAGATPAANGKQYVKAIGLEKVSESEAVSVGQYLRYNVSFLAADLQVPMPAAFGT